MAIDRAQRATTRRPFGAAGEEDPQLLFILGAPRSGTSLVYRALALHPDAAWINNYQRRIPPARPLAGLNRVAAAMPATRARVWFGADGGNAYCYNKQRSVLDRWFPQPVEGEPLFRHRSLPEQSDSRQPTSEQLQLRDDFRRIARFSGGSVMVSKRIGHNLRIPLLHSIFPTARFIDLRRDGRAVAASLMRVDWWEDESLWWYDGTHEQATAEGYDPALLAATHWVHEVEAIATGLRAVPTDHVLHVRYEQLVSQPMDTLAEVAAFGGLAADARWDAALQHLRFPDRNSSWRDWLADRADDVTAVQSEQLIALGYLDRT